MEVSLRLVAAGELQMVKLSAGLDTLGDRAHVEGMSE